MTMAMVAAAATSLSINPRILPITTTISWSFRASSQLHCPNLSLRRFGRCTADNLIPKEENLEDEEYRNGYGGLKFKGTVPNGSPKMRLDAWLSGQMQEVSRARIQSSVRQGLVQVNGDPVSKVVHPAPGNAHGTLVNGLLHHCGLPSVGCSNELAFPETEDDSDNEFLIYPPDCETRSSVPSSIKAGSAVRPGIVHRLDKGTSGLLVVAKDEHAHAHLSDQFKRHTVHRRYISLTCGVPPSSDGRIEVPIARDLNNRIRMAPVPNPNISRRARLAASRYHVIEVLAGGGSALVEWRLETGRTHQIRVHSQYLGYPLLGDDVYGGTAGMALSRLRPKVPSKYYGRMSRLVSNLQRPCLHAVSLGFEHPQTGKEMRFSCPPPLDFMDVLHQLRNTEV